MTDDSSARVRAEAARVVARVMAGRTLDDAMAAAAVTGLTLQNRSLLRALGYGVVRELALLRHLLGQLLEKPLQKQVEVEALLLGGLHQLRSMRMPAHAAVAETVNAVATLNAPWARGLVNAVLRRYQRERRTLEEALPTDPAVRSSHPAWMVDAFRRDWPQQWKPLLAANNDPGPMTLRVNRRRALVQDYAQRLPGAGLAGRTLAEAPDAVVLDEPVPIERVPGFAEGLVSVQDASAQFAADLLELRDGLRVLDACAAPGGKTAHILERVHADVTALDVDASRLGKAEATLARLQLSAALRQGDARRPPDWWDGRPFDRILVDAPCSGTGVIRRHPDIKWLRRAADIPRMAQMQYEMLTALWPLVASNGVLVYGVCSVLRDEGEGVVARFLESVPEAQADRLSLPVGEPTGHGWRIPAGGAFDGFYYARLRRR